MLSVPPHGAVHPCALRLLGKDPRRAFAAYAHQPQPGRVVVLVHGATLQERRVVLARSLGGRKYRKTNEEDAFAEAVLHRPRKHYTCY